MREGHETDTCSKLVHEPGSDWFTTKGYFSWKLDRPPACVTSDSQRVSASGSSHAEAQSQGLPLRKLRAAVPLLMSSMTTGMRDMSTASSSSCTMMARPNLLQFKVK